jgi:hypothetical protein
MSFTISDNTHALLNKLRLIGQIKEGDKLSTNGNNFYIYKEGWLNWVWRRWSHDSKDEGVRSLRDLYRSIDQATDSLITDTRSSNEKKHTNALYFIINIALELKNSIKGLENLTKTYVHYPTTITDIVGLVKDFIIVRYRILLNIIPQEKISKELKESITFRGESVFQGSEDTELAIDMESNNGNDNGKHTSRVNRNGFGNTPNTPTTPTPTTPTDLESQETV